MNQHPPLDALRLLRRRLLRWTTGLVLVWVVAIWWGERGIYRDAVTRCSWENWETWTSQAQPHHVLLIADPQLVDPHTYPDRPWPLSTLTIVYTDLYLRRAYRALQQTLQPESTLFLGDLFDGGREWGTEKYESPEDRYKSYGQGFWRKEYARFSNLYLQKWFHGPVASPAAPYGRKIIASVPGNHDLGFASGIDPTVKGRFDAYFGPLNRVDVLGNHSFVSLDTVSLSAMDQVDPVTGAHGGGDETASATASSHLWRPVEEFLGAAKNLRHRAVQHEWQRLTGEGPRRLFDPLVRGMDGRLPTEVARPSLEVPSSQFPTLILSHVPLYRPDNTPCGPFREGRPSIPLSAGYQYQNVLTPLISSDIIKHLDPEEIVQIYSGDDHDYCEISHSEYTGAIKEITVKSMSWAMGIRKPGVQLVSLWNPIDLHQMAQEAVANPSDVDAASSSSRIPAPKDTVQNHLCLLPDQLSIFIRYGYLLALTLVITAVDTIRTSRRRTLQRKATPYDKSEPLIPMTHNTQSSEGGARQRSSSIRHLQAPNGKLSSRSSYGNVSGSSRSASPPSAKSGYYSPAHETQQQQQHDPFAPAPHVLEATTAESDDWGMPKTKKRRSSGPLPPAGGVLKIFGRKVWQVAWPVLVWYLWLMWGDRARGI